MRTRKRQQLALIALVLCASVQGFGQTVRVGVFVRLKPKELVLTPFAAEAIMVSAGKEYALQKGTAAHSARIVAVGSRLTISVGGKPQHAMRVRAAAREGAATDFVLAVPGRIHRHFRGVLTVTAEKGRLIPVVEMDLETAVASAVRPESSSDAPMELLKAQAVVSRSYFIAEKRHRKYDFCDATHCQLVHAVPPANARASKATAATRGLVLAYRGKPFAAQYTASCSGRTLTLRELGIGISDYPYFSVVCAYCRRKPETWKSAITAADAARLKKKSEANRLNVARELGWKIVPSNSYEIEQQNGQWWIRGRGRGHGVGMCQRGAAEMAREGAGYERILSHYYPHTQPINLRSKRPGAVTASP